MNNKIEKKKRKKKTPEANAIWLFRSTFTLAGVVSPTSWYCIGEIIISIRSDWQRIVHSCTKLAMLHNIQMNCNRNIFLNGNGFFLKRREAFINISIWWSNSNRKIKSMIWEIRAGLLHMEIYIFPGHSIRKYLAITRYLFEKSSFRLSVSILIDLFTVPQLLTNIKTPCVKIVN